MFLILLVVLVYIAIHLTPVQNWIVKKVADNLSKKLQTKVSVKHVNFSLFNKMELVGVMVEDRKADTLLYAGKVNVSVTDWFFLRDKATLHYIGLRDAVVNMNRIDSVWNYQFLVDYFSSPKKDTLAKDGGLEFDFKKIELSNIRFNQSDKWTGKDFIAYLKTGSIDANVIDFSKKHIEINAVKLDEPFFAQLDYPGKRISEPASTTIPVNAVASKPSGWHMSLKALDITNGTFKNEKQTVRLPYTDRFDGQHLLFSSINAGFRNLLFANDTLVSSINISAKEKSGIEIKSLTSNAKMNSVMMEFNDLELVTNNSRIGDYYAMRYTDFDEDMSSFLHNVTIEAKLKNTIISSDDLSIFAPALKTWHRNFNIDGNALGKVDNFSVKKMTIKTGNTLVEGDINIHGLPDMQTTFIDFTSRNLETNYSELIAVVPSLKNVQNPRLSKLGNIKYKGNFTGFINDFVAFGTVSTNLGTITTDLNMKLPVNRPAVYSGKIVTSNFNLGGFLNTKELGTISLNGKISGKGFTIKELVTDFEGKISQIEYLGYNYRDLVIDGKFEKKLFKGNASINDPNLVVEALAGTINFNEELPSFKVTADLKKSDFKSLRLTRDAFRLNGRFNLDFKGSTIDNFSGTASITDAMLSYNEKPLSFDMLNLTSSVFEGKKILAFETNEAEGNITGNFVVAELAGSFNLFLNKYYPSYFSRPTRNLSAQDFTFFVKTKRVDEFVQLLDKKLEGFDNARFSGRLQIPGNQMEFFARVPEFKYDGKVFTNVKLESRGQEDSLITVIDVDEIAISDSFHFPRSNLKLLTIKGQTDLQLKTTADKTLSNAELNARITSLSEGVNIHFFPSSFYINNKKWDLEKDGELSIYKNRVDASEIKFVQGNQSIVISTELDEETNSTTVVALLEKINILDFAPFLVKNPRMEGLLTGTLKLKDPFGKQKIEFTGQAKDFVMENKSIATIDLKANADLNKGMINFSGNGKDKNDEFNFAGNYNLKDSTDNAMEINFTSTKFDVNNLEPYLSNIFSDLQGNVIADLKVTGGSKHQYLTGSVQIEEGSLKVKYTNCKYKFTNETIIFNPDEMDLGSIILSDTLGNTATAGGKMTHHFFKNFGFENILLKTQRMLLLNTTKRENPDFYGKIIGNATMTLDGPVSNLKMKIDGGPSSLVSDGNHFYLPSSSSKEVGTIDYIEFVQFGKQMQNESIATEGTNISVDLNLTANPACKVDVILDEATGDIIKGQGSGQLKIHVGNKEPLTMSGRYDISKGEYSFNFQTFIKKYFQITNGYINWDKDPYEATINIDAIYTATRVDLSSLNTSRGKFNQRADLNVVAHLTNTLKSPKINFEFKIPPQQSDFGNDPIVLESLKKFSQDENEMNRQVASLLLFNSFITDNNSGGIAGSGFSFLSGTAGQVLSNFLNNQFSKIFQKIFNDPTITPYLSFNSSFDVSSPELLNSLQASGNFGFKKEYLDGRLIVSLGGNVDYNNPYILAARNTNILLTPDITLEYILTGDGKLRILGFNRTSVDATLGQRNRTGVSLNYSKDFNNFSELFGPGEEKKRRRALRVAKKAE